jgi:UDP-galactopyranose mutase
MSDNQFYDIVIVGAGPSGLALAQCCSSIKDLKILIIEQESVIGGCHRVRRLPYKNEFLFTEHGPRVYSSTYRVFDMLLSKMDVSFTELFTPYNFNLTSIGKQTIWTSLNYSELIKISFEFLKLIINDKHGRDINLQNYLIQTNFSKKAIDIIDRICRLTDGAGIDKYTLNELLQLFNQQFFYKLYQPKKPNDEGLFKLWKSFLEEKGVSFMMNSSVTKLNMNNEKTKVNSVEINKLLNIYGKNFIIAIPPKSLVGILESSENINYFGNLELLKKWSYETAYIDYLSVTFHWDSKIDLPKIYGFPKTSWGVAYIVLSDYMTFKEVNSKTVISAAVTITHIASDRINKLPNECSENELIEEIFNQLKFSFPNLPSPTISLLSPGVVYKNNTWKSEDTAFITTANYPYLPFQSEKIKNLYNVGTHNGKQRYNFTSLESAVTNAVELSHNLFPELLLEYPINSNLSVTTFIRYLILVIVIYKILI